MVNRGEEKIRVHMNVVPRSTRNPNSGTEKHSYSTRHNIHMYPCSFMVYYYLSGIFYICKVLFSVLNFRVILSMLKIVQDTATVPL